MAAALPGHVVLLRLHHWVASRVGDLPPGFCIDVSAHADIRDLYLAADALVTDYSSVMFDFAVTGKPIVYFMPDMEHYRDVSRGFYFDITEEAPGPLCTVTDEVIEAFQDLPDVTAKFGGAYERFRAKFCHHDDGGASRRVVDRIFGS
jgi:CDP-glycerol glycerophosphotransferase